MPYNVEIDERIHRIVSAWNGTESRKMFGGICHLLEGKMFCGVYKDYLILRLGEKGAAEALESKHAKPFGITGRPMKGWVMVDRKGFKTDDELEALLEEAKGFVEGMKS